MTLEELRRSIDETDDEIARLYVRRMETVAGVAALKSREGGAISRPEREQEILRRVSESVPQDLVEGARELFTLLMELSKKYQQWLISSGEQ